jgi:hypothetical protein
MEAWASSEKSFVKPFVADVIGGDGNVENPKLSYGAMPASLPNENSRHRLDRMTLAIEFDESVTLKHHIDLSELSVIMSLRVLSNVDQMDRSHSILSRREGPPGGSARAFYRRYRVKLFD